MFTTLRSKLFFFITLVMLVTAAAILYFTYRDVGDAMRNAGKESAQNILNLVQLNIRGTYLKMRDDKISTIRERREQLRDSARISATVIKQFGDLASADTITEEEYRLQVLDWFKTISFPQQVAIFVFDDEGDVLAHTDQELVGTSIADLTDLKRRNLAEVMSVEKIKSRGDYAVFHWEKPGQPSTGKKMAYFMPIKDLNWTLGTVVSIGDIEAEAKSKLDKAIERLAHIFADITIVKTGCAMVFDGKRKVLIPPCEHLEEGQSKKGPHNLSDDSRFIDAVMDAAKSESGAGHYARGKVDTNEGLQIYASYFAPLDWYFAVYLPVEEIQQPAKMLVTRQSAIIGLAFVGSLFIFFFLVSRISRPLNLLAGHAKEIAGYDFSKSLPEEEDPVDKELSGYRDEVGRLAQSFSFMKAELSGNIKALMETTASNERILSELDVARSIQMGILPKIFPPFPDCKAFDLFATLEPAKSVGGDLYDYYFIDEDHLCFTIGDVSGKGVPAALFMAITRTLVKTLAGHEKDPARMMVLVNDALSQDNPNTMFVTLIIGVLNIRTGHVRYANGGHNPPIIIAAGEKPVYRKGLSGPVVGPMEEMAYSELEMTLKPGDSLFLYTDGVTEAMDENYQQFSDQRLLNEIAAMPAKSVTEVVNGVMGAVSNHSAKAESQSDDITMLMIRYNG